jgi:hypothetical protein
MKELIKEFKHIARDVTIYLLPGSLFIVYCVCLYIYCNNEWEYNMLFDIKMIIFILFIAYIIGHLILGLMEFLFVIIPLESKIKNFIFRDKNKEIVELEKEYNDAELEIFAFQNKEKYEFFVERHTLLSLFRWNLSGVFLITSIISFIAIFQVQLPWFIPIVQLFVFVFLLLFSIQTELDGKYRRYYLATNQSCK